MPMLEALSILMVFLSSTSQAAMPWARLPQLSLFFSGGLFRA